MSTTTIPMNGSLQYKTYDEAAREVYDPNYTTYMSLFRIADSISSFLDVPCPDIALAPMIRVKNTYDESISEEAAYGYHPEDFPHLRNSILLFSMKLLDPNYTIGVMAHELRHIWQKKYKPELAKTHAQGYTDSLSNPAEIDADAFGIWVLSLNQGITYSKAGSILCPTEKKYNPTEYSYRIEKAKEIEVQNHSNPTIIKTFFKKFRGA